MKNDIYQYFTDEKANIKTRETWLKKHNNELYTKIIKYTVDLDILFKQRIYHYIYDLKEIPKCPTCGHELKYGGTINKGYNKFCSTKCSLSSPETKAKVQQTKLERYGDSHYSNREKMEKTKLEKYGDKNFNRKKAYETKEIKYGNKGYNNHTKIKNTKKERYSNENYCNVEKTAKTKLKKYGHHAYNNPEKAKQTNLEKYGVENIMMLDWVQNLARERNNNTQIEKYSQLLNLNKDNLKIDGDFVTIYNYCKTHDSFEITKANLYDRFIHHNIKDICTKCNPISKKTSIKELEVKKYIENELNISTKKIRKNGKEIDIFIPSLNLGIEFNGLIWHSAQYRDKNYHKLKSDFFYNEENIEIFHIFEDDWIYKRELIKSMIKNKLNLISDKIYARKCKVNVVDISIAKNFLEKNHIQGNSNSKNNFGLYHNNELVSLMCFSLRENNIYELTRFCNKLNTVVVGGASKLFRFYENMLNPKQTITFADKTYSYGKLYYKLGFRLDSEINVDYKYFNKNELKRRHKFNFRLNKLKNKYNVFEDDTEHTVATRNGWIRIYDAGKLKFIK
jgi:hypothetical protein